MSTVIATGEVYRAHVITVRPYGKTGKLYEATCPYANHDMFNVSPARSRKEMRENIDAHLVGKFWLASQFYSGNLPCCPGGAE